MNNQAEKEQKELVKTEKESVIVLKKTFSDIDKIKIRKTNYNNKTGSCHMFVEMTNKKGDSVSFSYGFWKENKERGSCVLKNGEVQKKCNTRESKSYLF